jgi:hypothetical protein
MISASPAATRRIDGLGATAGSGADVAREDGEAAPSAIIGG